MIQRFRIQFFSLLFIVLASTASAQDYHDLTGQEWDVEAKDSRYHWNLTTLEFTDQENLGLFHKVEGYFFWIGSGGQYGREYFRGSYMPDGSLELHGYKLEKAFRLGIAKYQGRVSKDGNSITGAWSGNSPGGWSATR